MPCLIIPVRNQHRLVTVLQPRPRHPLLPVAVVRAVQLL
jgi:hypothetical protein